MIEYNGIEYPTRILAEIPDYGYDLLVSTIELQDVLLNKDYSPVDDEAKGIDTTIFYYCTPEEWQMDDETLIKHLLTVL